jgi:hypothetical protein
MVFIFGSGTSVRPVPETVIPFECSNCNTSRSFVLIEGFRYFHIFWIKITRWGHQYTVACQTCNLRLQVPTPAGAAAARAIGNEFAAIRQSPDGLTPAQAYGLIARVAQDVFDLPNKAASYRAIVAELESPTS